MSGIKKFLKKFKVFRDLNEAIKGPRPEPREVNLRAIENLALSPNLEFPTTLEYVQRIELRSNMMFLEFELLTIIL